MMQTFYEFLNMGGYALYVWSAYGIAAVCLLSSVCLPLYQKRQLWKKIQQQSVALEENNASNA